MHRNSDSHGTWGSISKSRRSHRRAKSAVRRATGATCEALEGRMLLTMTSLYNYSYVSQVYLGAELTRNDSQWQNYPAGPFQNTTITINLDNVPKYSAVSFGFSGGCYGTMGSFNVLVNGNGKIRRTSVSRRKRHLST